MRCDSALLDGEIVSLAPDGRSQFNDLMFRREWPYFMAFDLLWLDGKDLRQLPLRTRKRRLRGLMPRVESRLRYVDHMDVCGVELFAAACESHLLLRLSREPCKSQIGGSRKPSKFARDFEDFVVSRLGVEPRTRRLRVCCSAN